MQLSKLYANQPNFKNIEFNLDGLNIIYAEVKSESSEKKNSHDLGKTKLAELIDFLLLKEVNKKHFLLKIRKDEKSIFEDYIFYLEIYLNSGKYLTIKRAVSENTKISFSINDQKTNSFTPPSTWEYERLAIKKAKEILSVSLAFDFFKINLICIARQLAIHLENKMILKMYISLINIRQVEILIGNHSCLIF